MPLAQVWAVSVAEVGQKLTRWESGEVSRWHARVAIDRRWPCRRRSRWYGLARPSYTIYWPSEAQRGRRLDATFGPRIADWFIERAPRLRTGRPISHKDTNSSDRCRGSIGSRKCCAIIEYSRSRLTVAEPEKLLCANYRHHGTAYPRARPGSLCTSESVMSRRSLPSSVCRRRKLRGRRRSSCATPMVTGFESALRGNDARRPWPQRWSNLTVVLMTSTQEFEQGTP